MGHQESPPPDQPHRVHHHRRHRHHQTHHNHSLDPHITNEKLSPSLGRLNRVVHAPNSHAIVESWLRQVPAPAPAPVPSKSRNLQVHHRKRPRSQESDKSPYRRHPRLVDPSWRPQHVPPAQGPSPPPLLPRASRERNLKRYKRNSSDSSLISHISRSQEPRKEDRIEPRSRHEKRSRYKPLDEAEVNVTGSSSPAPHRGKVLAFEKRPRHKTRADKYETLKVEGHDRRKKSPGRGEHQPKRSKSKNKKPIVTGKNVMNNFASEAVINDRITVRALDDR